MYVVCMYVYRRLIFSLQTVNKPLLFYLMRNSLFYSLLVCIVCFDPTVYCCEWAINASATAKLTTERQALYYCKQK